MVGLGKVPRPLHEHSPSLGGDYLTLVVVATALHVFRFQLSLRSQKHPVTKATNETCHYITAYLPGADE